jgi:hypothetical protein
MSYTREQVLQVIKERIDLPDAAANELADALLEFGTEAAADEREACAKIADDWRDEDAGTKWGKSAELAAAEIAARIRQRGQG